MSQITFCKITCGKTDQGENWHCAFTKVSITYIMMHYEGVPVSSYYVIAIFASVRIIFVPLYVHSRYIHAASCTVVSHWASWSNPQTMFIYPFLLSAWVCAIAWHCTGNCSTTKTVAMSQCSYIVNSVWMVVNGMVITSDNQFVSTALFTCKNIHVHVSS